MKINLIKGEAYKYTADQLGGYAVGIVDQMTGNVNFTTPSPSLASVTAAIGTLKDAIAETHTGSHAAVAAKREATKALRTLLGKLARYVNVTADGDLIVALSSGFPEVKASAPINIGVPAELAARYSAVQGTVDLDWSKVDGANAYRVMYTAGDPNQLATIWNQHGFSTKTRYRASELTPGVSYSFRVCAIGATGQGGFSEIVSFRAA